MPITLFICNFASVNFIKFTMEKKYLFRYASVDGLILSSITVAVLLISPLLRNVPYVGFIVTVAKIAGCLTLLYYLMKKYAWANNCKRYGECFGYGLLVCLFSSFVCAAFSYISAEFIYSGIYEQQLLEMREIFLASNSGGTTNAFEFMLDNYSVILFFSSLVYYFIIGLIFSAIFAGSVRIKDPFANNGESF